MSWNEHLKAEVMPGLSTGDVEMVEAAGIAAMLVYAGGDHGDTLVVVPRWADGMPGADSDGGVTTIAAIDLLRFLVDFYEDDREAEQ